MHAKDIAEIVKDGFDALKNLFQALAFGAAGAFFLYKWTSGFLVTNLSLSIECDRKPRADKTHDDLSVLAKVSKGDRGSIILHDAQARISHGNPPYVSFADTVRLSFEPAADSRFATEERKVIKWDEISRESPLIRLTPGEEAEMSCHCIVLSQTTCKVEVVVLGFHSNAWAFRIPTGKQGFFAQWRGSRISLPCSDSSKPGGAVTV